MAVLQQVVRGDVLEPHAEHVPKLSDEQGAALHAELDALPEKYRRAITLFHLEGRNMRETAAALGCPEATTGTWLARGGRSSGNGWSGAV